MTRSKIFGHSSFVLAIVLAAVGTFGFAAVSDAQFIVLHSFPPSNPVSPKAPLIRTSDGNFYGTTESGGAFNLGTAFKMTPDGTVTLLHSFASSSDGASPVAALLKAADGDFYGTTPTGGASGSGTVFKMTAAGTVTILHAFAGGSDGATPMAGLIQATDGNFYGTTRSGGSSNRGTAFKMTPGGAVTILHMFGSTDGRDPIAPLIQATDGNLYGTTISGGGPSDGGTIFKMAFDGSSFAVMHTFASEGANSNAGLIQASDGNLYGTAEFGGAFFNGTVFKMTLAGAFTTLHAFGSGSDGSKPVAALVQGLDGNFYGSTLNGGPVNKGTVFQMTPAGVTTILHAFVGGSDGFEPLATLVSSDDGTLYGTVSLGGTPGAGNVYTISSGGAFNVLHTFIGSADGILPQAGLIQGSDGNFYGTTTGGGESGAGTVFTITSGGIATVLHAFNYIDGSAPFGALVQGTDGNFYGTTRRGGAFSRGTVFAMTPAGAITVLHAFNGADGSGPASALIQASDGNFYGTTIAGGSANSGAAFRINASGAFTLIHSFTGADGSNVIAGLVQATDGFLYGTASTGGAAGSGTAFRMAIDGTTTVLHSFANGADGAAPKAALIQGIDGNFYGTTQAGGSAGRGTAFMMTPGGAVTVLHAFTGGVDGSFPTAPLLQSDEFFYGSAQIGTAFNRGAIFKMSSTGAIVTLHTFAGAEGSYPNGALIRTADRTFYGTSTAGGATESGAVFKFRENHSSGDFDGDGKADITVYRPSTGEWFASKSSTNYATYSQFAWGVSTDIPVPGDYDGDGKADAAVYRPSTGAWYILMSSTSNVNSITAMWGISTDIPVPRDYDGDGKIDIAVYRPSTGVWYILTSSSGYASSLTFTWGASGDVPMPGDYDGDGRADLTVYRPSNGTWYGLRSSAGYATYFQATWGVSTDIPVAADYDGDGRSDVAVFRPSTGAWYVLQSSSNYTTSFMATWGISTDLPVPGDFDGDGRADIAVFRRSTGTWYVLQSISNYSAGFSLHWGASNDMPVTSSH